MPMEAPQKHGTKRHPRPSTIVGTLRSLRWFISNLWTYSRRRSMASADHQRVAWFDLRANVFHRYLLDLMLMLNDQGYEVRMRFHPKAVATWNTSLLLRFVPHFRFYLKERSTSTDLRFSDRTGVPGAMVLDPDYFQQAPLPSGSYVVPMPMVDSIYTKGLHKWVPDLLRSDRSRKIFFVGNIGPEYAASEAIIADVFGCFSRPQLIDLIERHFPHRIHRPSDTADLFRDRPEDILVMDRRQFNIPHEDLRAVMARHDFFLAPAGVIMPLCHNLTEAMSVGCIPILQHPHLLHPPLEDRITCLGFKDLAGLRRVLEEVQRMNDEEVMAMRRNVLDYYQKHLSPEAVVARLASGKDRLTLIHLNAEHLSVDLLRERAGRIAPPADTGRP